MGKLLTLPGHEINAIAVRHADVLIVRSTTRVNRELLDKSRVRYVATASAGYDHVDIRYLKKRGIHFFAATGCNANAVAEYIVVAIATLAQRYGFRFNEITLGIVGAGNIGSRVATKAAILGMDVVLNDPPLQEKTRLTTFVSLESLLRRADVVTIHVPLTHDGPYPTRGMVNESFLSAMKTSAFLINSSRGAVVQESCLKRALNDSRIGGAVLDVWENEPNINIELLQSVEIATPHIAGFSIDGKVNATRMVYHDVCTYLGVEPSWQPSNLPKPEKPRIDVSDSADYAQALMKIFEHAYPILEDDALMRKLATISPSDRPHYFERLRNEYRVRREFNSYCIEGAPDDIVYIAKQLGFKTA